MKYKEEKKISIFEIEKKNGEKNRHTRNQNQMLFAVKNVLSGRLS